MNNSAELFVALQRVLPKHFLSRLIARAAESEQPWLKEYADQPRHQDFRYQYARGGLR